MRRFLEKNIPPCWSFRPSAALRSQLHSLLCACNRALHTNENPAQSGMFFPGNRLSDLIPAEIETLDQLFRQRVEHTPHATAYRAWDAEQIMWYSLSWLQMAERVSAWKEQLEAWGVSAGERLAILLENGPAWVAIDQSAHAVGAVTVPLFFNDRPENMAYVIGHSEATTLVLRNRQQWHRIEPLIADTVLQRVVQIETDWKASETLNLLWERPSEQLPVPTSAPSRLATIIYTSGTTGQPKGVMLSHQNILSNCFGAASVTPLYPEDTFLSFLPLSHALERTVGYYLPMFAGCSVAFAQSVETIRHDLLEIRPTVLIAVPRLFEKVNERFEERLAMASHGKRLLVRWAQRIGIEHFRVEQRRCCWRFRQLLYPLLDRLVGRKIRAIMGGRLRIVVSGGAPLLPAIADRFIGFGVPILQGYGLTECSPVVSGNSLAHNEPDSVGRALPDTSLKIQQGDGELLVRGPGVMMGYWKNEEATAAVIDHDQWLHTGDIARIESGTLYITGRIKEILVLSSGEKVSPVDIEMAILQDPWIDQVMIVGEGDPSLTALVVLSERGRSQGSEAVMVQRIAGQMHAFPGYAKVKRVVIAESPWTLEEGLVTPTMKLRRERIIERFREQL